MAKHAGGKNDAPRGDRVVTSNRRAFHDYFIEEEIEAGIVLTGAEIKSVRDGKITIGEAYVRVMNGEVWLIGAHITPWDHEGGFSREDPTRTRKLLVHKRQIVQLREATERQGLTIIPLRVKIRQGRAKVDIGIARGKHLYDKRQSEKERDAKREIDRARRDRE